MRKPFKNSSRAANYRPNHGRRRGRSYPRYSISIRKKSEALLKISHRTRGALLCDGVGLGKTFVGLLLIERLIVHDRKRVLSWFVRVSENYEGGFAKRERSNRPKSEVKTKEKER